MMNIGFLSGKKKPLSNRGLV